MIRKIAIVMLIAAAGFSLEVAGSSPPDATQLPRARDGKPNLSGIWQVLSPANFDLEDHSAQAGVPAGQA